MFYSDIYVDQIFRCSLKNFHGRKSGPTHQDLCVFLFFFSGTCFPSLLVLGLFIGWEGWIAVITCPCRYLLSSEAEFQSPLAWVQWRQKDCLIPGDLSECFSTGSKMHVAGASDSFTSCWVKFECQTHKLWCKTPGAEWSDGLWCRMTSWCSWQLHFSLSWGAEKMYPQICYLHKNDRMWWDKWRLMRCCAVSVAYCL